MGSGIVVWRSGSKTSQGLYVSILSKRRSIRASLMMCRGIRYEAVHGGPEGSPLGHLASIVIQCI